MSSDVEAVKKAVTAAQSRGRFVPTSETIWDRAAKQTMWKVRCDEPVPVIDRKGKAVASEDGTPELRIAPPLRIPADTDAAAIAIYRERERIPASARVYAVPAPVKHPHRDA